MFVAEYKFYIVYIVLEVAMVLGFLAVIILMMALLRGETTLNLYIKEKICSKYFKNTAIKICYIFLTFYV